MEKEFFAVVFFLIILGIGCIVSGLYCLGTRRKTVFVVKEKGTLTHGYSNEGRGVTYTNFMIYTRDNRAFKNVNSIWYWKWRSTELQAYIKVGQKYSAEIYGWRIGAFNIYPNIIRLKEVKSNMPGKTKKRR